MPERRPPATRPRVAPRSRLAAWIAVPLLLLAAVACGPLAADASASVDYREGATYTVPAGTTLYVRHALTLGDLDLTVDDVRRANLRWIPTGLRGESVNASTQVTMTPPDAPDDWQVRLWQARFVRERPLGRPDGPVTYRVEVDLRVDVPASAYDLTRRVSTRIAARDGGAFPMTFLVRAE